MLLDVGELFERYHGVVYRRCLALLRHSDDAAEAVQEVFEKAIAGLGRFKLKAAPLTWLYAIATRHCLQKLRNHSLHQLKQTLLVESTEHQPDLSARLELEEAVAALSLEELELLAHAFRDGLTQDEISEVMRISRKTVGKKLAALSAKLQLSSPSSEAMRGSVAADALARKAL
ncbi:MAG: RNA polymerase sigma factor [Myxococcota bacterium]